MLKLYLLPNLSLLLKLPVTKLRLPQKLPPLFQKKLLRRQPEQFEHLKKDGTVDKRFKSSQRLKKDGTPDMRYKENKKS